MCSLRHYRQCCVSDMETQKPPPMTNTIDHYQNADTNNLLAQHDYQFDNCNSQGN